jgi:Fe-S-cluster-containing dehydrogenase component/DMSO reductase anchor subunit
MAEGFIFDHNKCVNCGACGAACILENGWSVQPREVYTYNTDALISLPLINLSLACNHCETAVCLEGCPSSSFFRDHISKAVVIDDNKCIGCRYCQWNCPYDAPKFDYSKRIIGKCNLCYSGLIEGRLPACTYACPTGALSYGEIPASGNDNIFKWLPDKKLNPSLSLTGKQNTVPVRIIPENIFEPEISLDEGIKSNVTGEWILVMFTFLVTLSVSSLISSLFMGKFPDILFFVSTLILAGIISLFHLGKKSRAWRAVSNLKTSPLSREIALFIIYSLLSVSAVSFHLPLLLILSSFAGLIMLIIVDTVYIYADKRKKMVFHSGQTFLSGLLIVSFLTANVIPFIFIALIKLVASVNNILIQKINSVNFSIRFLRIALLLITGISFISGLNKGDTLIISLFLTGELFDRIIFYIDFDPDNINKLIYKNITEAKYEKKRG